MMSILLSILIPAPAQGGIDTTTPPTPPPQGLIYQAKRHRTHPNTYFALKQRKLQLENSSFGDHAPTKSCIMLSLIAPQTCGGPKTIVTSLATFWILLVSIKNNFPSNWRIYLVISVSSLPRSVWKFPFH